MNDVASLFITGEHGFVGSHILRLKESIEADFGFRLASAKKSYDLLSPTSLDEVVDQVNPDLVIHLAGISFVPDSINNPRLTLEINTIGTLNLLESLKKNGFRGRFLFVSSGDVYGRLSADQLPVNEAALVKPLNPYAVSKVASEALCYQWSQSCGFEIFIARPFNHIGIGQREDFVIASMAKQIAEIKLGRRESVIYVGDIDVSRDFLDVEDVISGYMHLLKSGSNAEIYNICSGKDYLIRDLVEEMIDMAGIKVELVKDQSRSRPSDQRKVIGSNNKITCTTSWMPKIPIPHSLSKMLDDWTVRLDMAPATSWI